MPPVSPVLLPQIDLSASGILNCPRNLPYLRQTSLWCIVDATVVFLKGESTAMAPTKRTTSKKSSSGSGPKSKRIVHNKMEKTMHEFKHHELESGRGGKVKNPKQAIAIGLSEARRSGADIPAKPGKKNAASKSTRKRATKKTAAKKTTRKRSGAKKSASKRSSPKRTASKRASARRR
jgi:hypothetical protein